MDGSQTQRLRVAMVDDEEPLHRAVRRILDKFRVHVADVGIDVAYDSAFFTSGEQFLDSVGAGAEFDLLLLDLKLPGMTGLDVLTDLSQHTRPIMTIMITAYATFDTAVQATKLGAYDFLPKPFSPEELRYALRKATDQVILSREARRLAEEKRQVRFNFVSVLAHELKAPITAIEGYLRILQMQEQAGQGRAEPEPAQREPAGPEPAGPEPPEQPRGPMPGDRLQMIERGLLRLEGMRKLISDLLDLTRVESGQSRRSFTTLDLRAAAQAAADLFTPEAESRNISIVVRPAKPVEMVADPGEIEILLNNLVSNAVKYNRDGGSVTLTVGRDLETARIVVADTGIGLTAEESAKLFTEFVRIKNNDTVKIIGSGLGLSMVRKLAQLYGGEVTVDSTKGSGSTFTVSLHDAEASHPQTAGAPTR